MVKRSRYGNIGTFEIRDGNAKDYLEQLCNQSTNNNRHVITTRQNPFLKRKKF
jgi:hypothetical protein